MEVWQKVIKLDTVNSTNKHLAKLLKELKYPEGTLVSSLFQSEGKGQGSNSWESEKGLNILCSLVLYPDFLSIEKNFFLSKIVSLGIARYVQTKINHVKIKWPNDIYYQNKKLSGILIENTIKGSNINRCIVGIGFNLNQNIFLSNAPNPVSLNQISQTVYSVDQEIIILRDNIRIFYDKLRAGKFDEINQEYLKCLYWFDEFRSFKSDTEAFTAKITGISEIGHLQVLTENQEKKEFDFKEIEFVV